MPAGRGGDQRLHGLLVAGHVGHVGLVARRTRTSTTRGSDRRLSSAGSNSAPWTIAASRSPVTPMTSMPSTSPASSALPGGTMTRRTRLARGEHRGKDALHRPQPAVEPELAQMHGARPRIRRAPTRRREGRDRDRQIEPRTLLRQRGRRQVDGQLFLRERAARIDGGSADALAGLAQRGVRQSDEDECREAGRDVGLHLDDVPADAVEGDRRRCERAPSDDPGQVLDRRAAALRRR